MKKIPCKLCKSCGKYSSINITRCGCGADLTPIPGILVEYNRIPLDRFGSIDKELPIYVQKCSACGTANFTHDPEKRVQVCYNCNKPRVKSVLPILFEEEKSEPPRESTPAISPLVTGAPMDDGDEDDEDEDAPGGSLYDALRKNIQQATGTPAADRRPPLTPGAEDDDEDDEDEDDEDTSGASGIWGQLLGKKGLSADASGIRHPNAGVRQPASGVRQPAPATAAPVQPGVSTLTLSAIRYGNLTFTLRADSSALPYLLGRSAGCADFLRQDPRVGNEHCYLTYQNGNWMVIEKRAINGTAVNRRFLPEGGRQILKDGDELTLGHHPDSMAFRIRIR